MLLELQELNTKAEKIRAEVLKKSWKNIDGVLHHQALSFIPEIIRIEHISWYQNDLLADYLDIDKNKELVSWKYYWSTL